jgi:Yip1 domain
MLQTSPWVTMWFAPRVTVRRLVEMEEKPSWIPVVALAGLHHSLQWLQTNHKVLASDGVTAVFFALLFGGAALVYSVLIGPFLLAFVGGWLGGAGDADDIRQAVAWSYVPTAVACAMWIPVIIAYGWRTFSADLTPKSAAQVLALPPLLLISVAVFWTIAIQVGAVAEAQRFSILRSIASIVILSLPILLFAGL